MVPPTSSTQSSRRRFRRGAPTVVHDFDSTRPSNKKNKQKQNNHNNANESTNSSRIVTKKRCNKKTSSQSRLLVYESDCSCGDTNIQEEEGYVLYESDYTKPFRHELDGVKHLSKSDCAGMLEAVEDAVYEIVCGDEPSLIENRMRRRLVHKRNMHNNRNNDGENEATPLGEITFFCQPHQK